MNNQRCSSQQAIYSNVFNNGLILVLFFSYPSLTNALQLEEVILESFPFVPSGLTLSLSGALLDARTTEYFDSEASPIQPGTRMPLSAKKAYNDHLDWTGYAHSFELAASVNYSYSGERKNQLIETKNLPAYDLFSVSARVANSVWPLKPSLGLSITNLTNEKFSRYALQSTVNENQYVYLLGTPRTALLSLELSL